jgi:hypothetical protein
VTDVLDRILLIATVVGSWAGPLVLRHFGVPFFERKAANLADKQDIGEITDQAESAKDPHARRFEDHKATLSMGVKVHALKAQLEIESYKEIWTALVEVEAECGSLMERGYVAQLGKDDGAMAFREVSPYHVFVKTVETRRPFYDPAVYAHLTALRRAIQAIPLSVFVRRDEKGEELRERAPFIPQGTRDLIDAACDAIQQRIGSLVIAQATDSSQNRIPASATSASLTRV